MKVLVCGCGRIGSPLLTWLAYQNVIIPGCFESVAGVDVDPAIINKPLSPRFKEEGWSDLLKKINDAGVPRPIIFPYDVAAKLGRQDTVIITCGTPLDKNLNPDTSQLTSAITSLIQNGLVDSETLIILRSTIFPGGTRWLTRFIREEFNFYPKMVMAPERIAEGYTFKEMDRIPQIIGSDNPQALTEAIDFFQKKFGSISIIPLTTPDGGTVAAELAKLMCNTWRYIGFTAANEFAMIADEMGADFNAVRNACNKDYWRCYIPKAALNVGGPCLGKDAQILGAYSRNAELTLAAWNVAEKTAMYFLKKHERKIRNSTVGVLGLAFKANSDNPMNSLSYKLLKHLEIIGAPKIMVHDPQILHKYSAPLEDVIKESDIIFVMTEHKEYEDIDFGDALVIRL